MKDFESCKQVINLSSPQCLYLQNGNNKICLASFTALCKDLIRYWSKHLIRYWGECLLKKKNIAPFKGNKIYRRKDDIKSFVKQFEIRE